MFEQPIRIKHTKNSRHLISICVNNLQDVFQCVKVCDLVGCTQSIFRLGRLFSAQMVARMHPETASFQGGLRVYKIVMLGEGGVGKSGKKSILIEAVFLCNGT